MGMLPSVLVSETPAQAPQGLHGRDEQGLHQRAAEEDRQGPGEVHGEASCRHVAIQTLGFAQTGFYLRAIAKNLQTSKKIAQV